MEIFHELWLAICVSAAAVWIASAVVWMALPHHMADHRRLPDEKAFSQAMATLQVPPGNYGFPHCGTRQQSKDPDFLKQWEEGPRGILSMWGPMNMGRNMVLTLFVYLVVSTLIAYLGAIVLPRGSDFAHVFRVLGTVGILAYSFAFIPNNIWFGSYGRTIAMHVIDGIGYGLITGAIFAWLWPS
jgi:hypothetical protein